MGDKKERPLVGVEPGQTDYEPIGVHQPALSAEEWRDGAPGGYSPGVTRFNGAHIALNRDNVYITATDYDGAEISGADRHALAALALHGQPFGFTHEDVRLLRGAFDQCYSGQITRSSRLDDLANRIAALLPPNNHA